MISRQIITGRVSTELLYMDIVASLYNRNNLSAIVRRTRTTCSFPSR